MIDNHDIDDCVTLMQRAAERAEQAAEAMAEAFGLAKSFDGYPNSNEQILLLMTPVSLFTCGDTP